MRNTSRPTIAEHAAMAVPLLRLLANGPRILPMMSYAPADVLSERVRRHGDRPALLFENRCWTWRELDVQANRVANWAAERGVRRRQVVALMMDNRPEFVFTLLGLHKLGAITALIHTQLREEALAQAVAAGRADHVLVGGEHAAAAAAALPGRQLWVSREDSRNLPPGQIAVEGEIAAASPEPAFRPRSQRVDDVFCYIYTSGTTGLPKAAVIRNQRMLGANFLFGHLMHQSRPGDVIYVPLPLFHSNGLFCGLGAALVTGAAMALRRRFSATQFWSDIRRFDATSFVYIGELCRYLLQAPEEPDERRHRLRVAVGNGLSADVWQKFQARFGVPTIREFYGQTEGNAPVLNVFGRPGLIGRLRRGQAVLACDPETGEIHRNFLGLARRVRRGESGLLVGKIGAIMSFQGYVDGRETAARVLTNVFRPGDRWYNTGDLVTLHDHGWLSFADRLGDTFRWKGENVSTLQVAQILDRAPAVTEAMVYGVRVAGSEGRAGMAALRVTETFSAAALAAYARENLAPHQVPRFLRILREDVRITSTFKHQKASYQREGWHPDHTQDELWLWDGSTYVPLTREVAAAIDEGRIRVS